MLQTNILKAEDLQLGDVVFFMDAMGAPHHVAIYNGKFGETHFITHGVSDPYFSVMTTRLKEEYFPYRVFRHKSLALGAQAAARMRVWAEHQVPFSEEKHGLYETICDMNETCHPVTGGKAQAKLAQKYFAANFYRYIEFAAHPSMPYFPHGGENTQGMYCSEALAAAFNIEQLLMIDAIKSCAELNTVWVSDNINPKFMKDVLHLFPSEFKPTQRYMSYLKSSHSENEYPFGSLPTNENQPEENFLPSVCAWNYQKYGAIEAFVDNYSKFALPLDSKLATPWAILTFFEQHPEHWQDLGKLTVEKKNYPLEKLEENKKAWQNYVDKLFKEAKEKQGAIRSGRENQDSFEALLKIAPPTPKHKFKRNLSCGDLSLAFSSNAKALEQLSAKTQVKKIEHIASPKAPLKRVAFSAPNLLTLNLPKSDENNSESQISTSTVENENEMSALTKKFRNLFF